MVSIIEFINRILPVIPFNTNERSRSSQTGMVNQGYIMLRALGGRRWDGGANLPQWEVTARVPSPCSWIAGASTVFVACLDGRNEWAKHHDRVQYRLETIADVEYRGRVPP